MTKYLREFVHYGGEGQYQWLTAILRWKSGQSLTVSCPLTKAQIAKIYQKRKNMLFDFNKFLLKSPLMATCFEEETPDKRLIQKDVTGYEASPIDSAL